MSKALGPLEVYCDAPEYSVVRATRKIGVVSPEDVPWRRIRSFLGQKTGGRNFLFDLWRSLCSWGIPAQKSCPCGADFPRLRRIRVTFDTGEQERFLLGQCPRCRTVFWEHAEQTSQTEPTDDRH